MLAGCVGVGWGLAGLVSKWAGLAGAGQISFEQLISCTSIFLGAGAALGWAGWELL